MPIEIGSKVPTATVLKVTEEGPAEISTRDLFDGRKVVVFGLPGAFTPTCSLNHLPGFIENHDIILAKGVDEIVCVSVNDHHVMKAWAEATGAMGDHRLARRKEPLTDSASSMLLSSILFRA